MELEIREKKRKEAQQLCTAAQRNLDSYIASLRAMNEESVVPSYSQLPGSPAGGKDMQATQATKGPKGKAKAKPKAKGK